MIIADIHHVSINVSDVDRSLTFYVGTLGLRALPRPDLGFPGAWLDAGAGREVHLLEGETPTDLGQHFAFRVEDIDAACTQLRSAGIDVKGPFAIGAARQAFLHDPDGNRLELNEPAPAS